MFSASVNEEKEKIRKFACNIREKPDKFSQNKKLTKILFNRILTRGIVSTKADKIVHFAIGFKMGKSKENDWCQLTLFRFIRFY